MVTAHFSEVLCFQRFVAPHVVLCRRLPREVKLTFTPLATLKAQGQIPIKGLERRDDNLG